MPSVAILAGGKARRLNGVDKSVLRAGSQSILERQLEAAHGISDDVLLVGGCDRRVVPAGTRCLDDRIADAGPLGGLDAALLAARHPELVLLACDMPFVTAPFLRFLLDQIGDDEAVVPHTERGYHPLCAVYASACVPSVAGALADGDLRMLNLLARLRVRVVEGRDIDDHVGPATRLLTNVNTPADLNELETLLAHNL